MPSATCSNNKLYAKSTRFAKVSVTYSLYKVGSTGGGGGGRSQRNRAQWTPGLGNGRKRTTTTDSDKWVPSISQGHHHLHLQRECLLC